MTTGIETSAARSAQAGVESGAGEVLAVRAQALTKRYGALTAVDSISMSVAQGEVYGVLGPNGAGKTTLLRMLFGLVRPDAGTLEVFGRTWSREGAGALAGVAGFIESPRFYPYLSGRRNLQLLAGLDGGAPPAALEEALERVDLTKRAKDKVSGYSFGMRQRLGVAAALVRSPRLLVLDEPANGLDPAGIRDMRALVQDLAGDGLTVLLSSHDMDEVEQICDNVTIMDRGAVAYHGSIGALREQAPPQAHLLATTADHDALAIARASYAPTLQVEAADGHLAVRGAQDAVDAYVADVVGAGIAIRFLTPGQAPLESLFFALTDPERAPAALTTAMEAR